MSFPRLAGKVRVIMASDLANPRLAGKEAEPRWASSARRAATRLLARWARRRAVSAGSDATVRVWDLDAGEPLHTLARRRGLVNAVAVTARHLTAMR